jgi:hypothetical protein
MYLMFWEVVVFPFMGFHENVEAGVEATHWCVYLVHVHNWQCPVK